MVMKRLLTEGEAAEYLSVKPRTLRRFAKDGVIPSRKIGVLRRYDKEEIDAWLDATGNKTAVTS